MGVYDTLVDGERSAQVKCFDGKLATYKAGDQVPCDGSFIIVLPEYEGAEFAIVKDGVFIGFTDCPPVIIDKWGKHLISYDAFKNPYEEIVDSLRKTVKNDG